MEQIICKRCQGKGLRPLAPSLALVFLATPKKDWIHLGELHKKLAKGVSSASLHARLAKLVAHGLLKRVHDGSGYAWSRS